MDVHLDVHLRKYLEVGRKEVRRRARQKQKTTKSNNNELMGNLSKNNSARTTGQGWVGITKQEGREAGSPAKEGCKLTPHGEKSMKKKKSIFPQLLSIDTRGGRYLSS
jgi:hypothetical protein